MKYFLRSAVFIQAFIVACLYAVAFSFSPLNGEDYGLTRHFTQEGVLERLSWSLSKSMNQIETWNARLGEQLSIFSLSMPDYIFFIIAMASVSYLCYVLSTLLFDNNKRAESFIISMIFVFLLWPGFELFTWRTVITGYTVPMLLTLTVISKFMNESRRESLQASIPKLIGYCAIGFLSGLSYENVPVATIFFLLTTIFIRGKIKSRLTMVPLFVLAGWIILITAPSTTLRRMQYHEWYQKDTPFLDNIQARVIDVTEVFFHTSTILFIAAILSLAYLCYKKLILKEHMLLLASSVLVVGSMIASPYTEARSFMLAWCVMLAFVVSAMSSLLETDWRYNLAIVVVGFMSIYVSHELYKQTRDFYMPLNARASYIESRLNSSECASGIKVDLVRVFCEYRYVNNRDEWYYYNLPQVSEYYGCKIVK